MDDEFSALEKKERGGAFCILPPFLTHYFYDTGVTSVAAFKDKI